jgi:hypothetical protein
MLVRGGILGCELWRDSHWKLMFDWGFLRDLVLSFWQRILNNNTMIALRDDRGLNAGWY